MMDEPNTGKVLLSGASGMIGSAVGTVLHQRNAKLLRLVRRAASSQEELRWNPATRELNADLLEGFDAAVHLSGANVAAKRWSPAYMREMRESRIETTALLAQTLASLARPPSVLVTASAVGFYGDRGDEILDEDSAAGHGYLAGLCTAWEAAAHPAEAAGIRVVHLRFGVVIGRGGAMARLAPLFRMGLGGPLGSGRQWMSWVSEADAVRAVLFALARPDLSGPVNVTAPSPVTNAEFARELGRAVHRPALLPAPAFALRLAFGVMANEVLLASSRAVPRRLMQAGFVFEHPALAQAFAAIL